MSEGGTGICEPTFTCGNNRLEADEGCDDGEIATGDGCNAMGKIEDGPPCNADSSGSTGDASCASELCDVDLGARGVCGVSRSRR